MGDLNHILQRLQESLGPLSGEPAALDGGITNRNYRVTLGAREYVVRLPGKDTDLLGIDREAERIANTAAAELGIAPAVALALEECLVTDFIACASVSEGEVADGVEELAAALRAFHDSPTSLPTRFWVPDLLADYAEIVHRRGGTLPDAYEHVVSVAKQIEAALPLTDPRPCHDDLLPGNIIRADADGRLMIVDWEYAGMGDPRFDLGNLAVNNDLDEAAEGRLLAAYHGAAPSDSQRAALKLMRVLSDAREGAWGVVQAHVSELDFDFHGYAAEHFERLRTAVEHADHAELIIIASQSNREDTSRAQTP
ncbi:MAG TPA: phosphotransferase [Solirubrobacteraceae bacterium]|nr:phosphotransferase [Solirubrobacteraceae bacterium]